MFGDTLVLNVSELTWPADSVKIIRIEYETTQGCSAAQWLTPEQTVGKAHPYLFTQCQAIHARSLLTCQVHFADKNSIIHLHFFCYLGYSMR